MGTKCGNCSKWLSLDFNDVCPVMKTGMNNLAQKMKNPKMAGKRYTWSGVGVNDKGCKNYGT